MWSDLATRETRKDSCYLGNHQRLKFVLPEEERAAMKVWGGQISVA